MSIVWSLRKFVDPIAHREAEAAQERDRRVARQQELGTDGEDPVATPSTTAPARYQCRVCDHLAADGTYCPHCLADTMVAAPDLEHDQGISDSPPPPLDMGPEED